VVNAAKARDEVAAQIVADGGTELGRAAVAVIRHLQMERDRFQIAYVGGVFRAAGDLMLDTLRAEVKKVAPRAFFEPPQSPNKIIHVHSISVHSRPRKSSR
jgi:HD-like signal output (HDOD) protein